MKYSFYVKNYLKRQILKNNPHISESDAKMQAEEEFKELLLDTFYESALAKLDDNDKLKKLELEDEYRFLDINYGIEEYHDIENPYLHLYHGVRLDPNHETFESILRDREIKCAKKANTYRGMSSENCNEGKYVSLTHYTGEDHDIEFMTFIEENVSFIISSKLNPVKCKYLNYEEWEMIKKKLPKTRHRYSYARGEYQYPDGVSFDYVEGILYPLNLYSYNEGFTRTQNDLLYIKELLVKYGLGNLPIVDPTDGFKVLDVKLRGMTHGIINKFKLL